MTLNNDDRDACLRVLQQVADEPTLIEHDERFKALVAKVHRNGKKSQRAATRAQHQAEDRATRARAGMVARQLAAPALHNGTHTTGVLHQTRPCYICKQPYTEMHWFYHALCPACAALNAEKRVQQADLSGRVALLTGGRVKIGYYLALRLLRDGARVLLTTRFPRDAARRFASEPDAHLWRERLVIHGLDLRDIAAVEAFVAHLLATEPRLDILINNAAQTVKRPRAFYQHLLDAEATPLPDASRVLLAPMAQLALLEQHPTYRSELPDTSAFFPSGALDADGQQLDLRPDNSWRARLGDVSTVELLETQLVNAVAPFVLAGKLKPLLLASPHARRFVINVSAMEGQFARETKTTRHPHTNMAKAALNMLTRTSAADYARDTIYMNSVDTGWITDENPFPQQQHAREEQYFFTPLDAIDAVARIYDPIAQGINNAAEPVWGQFLKDYRPFAW